MRATRASSLSARWSKARTAKRQRSMRPCRARHAPGGLRGSSNNQVQSATRRAAVLPITPRWPFLMYTQSEYQGDLYIRQTRAELAVLFAALFVFALVLVL